MSNLIVRMPLRKKAAEDGPTLEQQFGIITNANIVAKYPKLDSMKLAFQLIDKTDDDKNAVGAAVYIVGTTVIFIPSFYKQGKISTGDMMFLPQTQQFLPLSDPWLSWVQNKDLKQSGTIADKPQGGGQGSVTVKQLTDPIVKTACVYLKGLLRSVGSLEGLTKVASRPSSIFGMALGMGKKASEEVLDNLIGNKTFLNAALSFYGADHLESFSKQASRLGALSRVKPAPKAIAVEPFTKEAIDLTAEEKEVMNRDGFVVVEADGDDGIYSDVIRTRNIRGLFSVVSSAGPAKLMTTDGDLVPVFVVKRAELNLYGDKCNDPTTSDIDWSYQNRTYEMPVLDAARYMNDTNRTPKLAYLDTATSSPRRLPCGAVKLTALSRNMEKRDISSFGHALSDSVGKLEDGDCVLCPDGVAYEIRGTAYKKGNSWCTYSGLVVKKGTSIDQTSPMVIGNTYVMPRLSRVLTRRLPEMDDAAGAVRPAPSIATADNLDAALKEYCRKRYHKVKVSTIDGSLYMDIDGEGQKPITVKEASLRLVNEFGAKPADIRGMLRISKTSGSTRPESFLISKRASESDTWEESPVSSKDVRNNGPELETRTMPDVQETPEQLQEALKRSAETGLKEVFDVTAFKMLIRSKRVLEDVQADISLFIRTLDSLCRKLFLLYWHTDEFEERYGSVKIKSLEEGLKASLDSLSELTIFFKLRNVSEDSGFGQDGGDLMRGYDM